MQGVSDPQCNKDSMVLFSKQIISLYVNDMIVSRTCVLFSCLETNKNMYVFLLNYVLIMILQSFTRRQPHSNVSIAVSCPSGYQMLYMDPEQLNPTCIMLLMDGTNLHTWEEGQALCTANGGYLAEPEGWLHHEVYDYIYNQGEPLKIL